MLNALIVSHLRKGGKQLLETMNCDLESVIDFKKKSIDQNGATIVL